MGKFIDNQIPGSAPDGTYLNYENEEQPGTLFTAEVMNSIAFELTNILTKAGILPSYVEREQIYTAIKKFYSDADEQVKIELMEYVRGQVKDKAQDISFNDTVSLGATNVQTAITKLLEKITANTTALGEKLDIAEFEEFETNNTNLIGTKLDTSIFNQFRDNTNTELGKKLNKTEFEAFKTTNTEELEKKEDKANLLTVAKTDVANTFTENNTFKSIVINNPATDNENPIRKQEFDSSVSDLNNKITALEGGSTFIGVDESLSAEQIKEDLTALDKFVQITVSRPARKGDMVNSNDGIAFIYTGEKWVEMGSTKVAIATNTVAGVVKGTADEDGAISVAPDGKMTVNGFNKKFDTANLVNTQTDNTNTTYTTAYIEKTFATKPELNTKVNTTDFEEFKTSNTEALNLKADKTQITELDNKITANTNALAQKVDINTYEALDTQVDLNTQEIEKKANDTDVLKNNGLQVLNGSLVATQNQQDTNLGAINIRSDAGFFSISKTSDNTRLAYIGYSTGVSTDLNIVNSKGGNIVMFQKAKSKVSVDKITENDDLITKEYVDNIPTALGIINQAITTDTQKVPSCNAVKTEFDNLRGRYIAQENLKAEYSENADAVYNTVFVNGFGGMVNGNVGRDLKVLFNTQDVKTVFLKLQELAKSPNPNRFGNLRVGDYIDLASINDGETTVNWNATQENLRLVIVGFDHYYGFPNDSANNTAHHVVFQFKNAYKVKAGGLASTDYTDMTKTPLYQFLNGSFLNGLKEQIGIEPIAINKYIVGSTAKVSVSQKVFLPSEMEIWGTPKYSFNKANLDYAEQGHLRQFPLYAINPAFIKKTFNGDAVKIALGDMVYNNKRKCCGLSDKCLPSNTDISLEYGFTPVFCIG